MKIFLNDFLFAEEYTLQIFTEHWAEFFACSQKSAINEAGGMRITFVTVSLIEYRSSY